MASGVLKCPGEFFDNRCFASAAHREISDGDDQRTGAARFEDAFAKKPEAEPDNAPEDAAQHPEHEPKQGGAFALSPFKDDLDGKLFEFVQLL